MSATSASATSASASNSYAVEAIVQHIKRTIVRLHNEGLDPLIGEVLDTLPEDELINLAERGISPAYIVHLVKEGML